MTTTFDVAIVGSGPSGALAAWKLVQRRCRVLMIDVGHDDDQYRQLIPDEPFSRIRRSDDQQRRYFLGDRLEGIPHGDVKVGAQLTPPRQFVTEGAEEHLPCSGRGFEPMQSLALGGLGAAWGAASFTYSDAELRQLGIHAPGFERYFDEVVATIGVSGAPEDDASREVFSRVSRPMAPLELDSMAEDIWERYRRDPDRHRSQGFRLGRTPLAVLSEDLGERCANPYFDMDFWSDVRKSVFRPRYLIESLSRSAHFVLERGHLVTHFDDQGEAGVAIRCLKIGEERGVELRAKRLMLCAGAIGSARLALNSLSQADVSVPILCNPYTYIPCVNWRLLGSKAKDRKHSMSQLTGVYAPPDDPDDLVTLQMYGYRSLLLFKLVKEMPLPTWAGLRIGRLLMNSLMIGGLHHSDSPGPGKTMRIRSTSRERLPSVEFDYHTPADQRRRRADRQRAVVAALKRLGLVPLQTIEPGAASSIHYAGTLPLQASGAAAAGTTSQFRLNGTENVFVADSSSWRHLPAKGLTLTLMANALRIAEGVADGLSARS